MKMFSYGFMNMMEMCIFRMCMRPRAEISEMLSGKRIMGCFA